MYKPKYNRERVATAICVWFVFDWLRLNLVGKGKATVPIKEAEKQRSIIKVINNKESKCDPFTITKRVLIIRRRYWYDGRGWGYSYYS